jgi:hypothetical protein
MVLGLFRLLWIDFIFLSDDSKVILVIGFWIFIFEEICYLNLRFLMKSVCQQVSVLT